MVAERLGEARIIPMPKQNDAQDDIRECPGGQREEVGCTRPVPPSSQVCQGISVSEMHYLLEWRKAVASKNGPASPTTRHVLLTLSVFMNAEGSAFPSTSTLADSSGLSERSVCTHLEKAEEEGWITRADRAFEGQQWKRKIYQAVLPKALNHVQHLNDKGTEPHAEGTEPLSKKALKEVQSKSLKDNSTIEENNTNTAHARESRFPFEDFWDTYDHKQDRKGTEKKWRKLSESDRAKIMDYLPGYVSRTNTDGTYPSRRYPTTFINKRTWLNELPPITEKTDGSQWNGNSAKPKRGDKFDREKLEENKKRYGHLPV